MELVKRIVLIFGITLFTLSSLQANEKTCPEKRTHTFAFDTGSSWALTKCTDSTEKENAAYYRTKGRRGIAMMIVSQGLSLIASVTIGVGGYYVLEYGKENPGRQNDISTCPEGYVPLYIGLACMVTSIPLFAVGLTFIIVGFVNYRKLTGKKVSLFLESYTDRFDFGIRIRI